MLKDSKVGRRALMVSPSNHEGGAGGEVPVGLSPTRC